MRVPSIVRGAPAPAGPRGDGTIVAHRLTKRYGSVTAVDGVDLDVPAGSVFGFLGPNGAGKTTTMRMLTGLGRPSAGEAVVAGVRVGSDPIALGQRIGHLDQSPRLFGWMKGRELLELAGRLGGLDGPALRSRVRELLDVVDLADAAERPIGGYSGGMRQRIGIAQAIVHRPSVLFLDEPVSALDPEGRRDVLEMLERLRRDTTVFMSTHILGDVERVCDRVAIMDGGRLVIEATIPDLLARYATPSWEIEVETGRAAELRRTAESLRARPWVRSVEVDGLVGRVTVRDPERAAAEVLAVAAETGLHAVRVERRRPTLEDVFLALVAHERPELREVA
ncbi:MAG: ABC transporter ATP-binding protein [Chloroflexota bacterium]